jgi:hypothetical protein
MDSIFIRNSALSMLFEQELPYTGIHPDDLDIHLNGYFRL